MKITLKAARTMRDMRQADVAAAIGMDRTCYCELEKQPERFSVERARRICEVLRYDMNDIIGFSADYTTS